MNSETKKTEIYTPYTSCCGKGKNNLCNICLRMLLQDFSRYDICSQHSREKYIELMENYKNTKKILNVIRKILYKKIILIIKVTPRTEIHNYYSDGKLIASNKYIPDNIMNMYNALSVNLSHRNQSNDHSRALLILKQVCDKDFKIIRGVYLENCSEKYFGIY